MILIIPYSHYYWVGGSPKILILMGPRTEAKRAFIKLGGHIAHGFSRGIIQGSER